MDFSFLDAVLSDQLQASDLLYYIEVQLIAQHMTHP